MKKTVLVLLLGVMLFSCKPSDEKLQTAVQTALTAAGSNVSSSVKEGVVTLSGTVDSEAAKIAAETAVKAVKDIKSISNNIEVKVPQAPVVINNDEVLTTAINAAITAGGFSDVTVSVKDGEVTLNGDAKKADLAKIMQIANEAKPAKVINNLNIK